MAARNLWVVADRILKNVEKIGSRQGVPHDLLQGLQKTISQLVPWLLDAEKMSWDDDRVKDWVMELDDALYDADNLLGESTEALQQSLMTAGDKMFKVRSYFFSVSRPENMRQEINNIGKRLDQIAAQGRDLNLKECREKEFMELDKNVIVQQGVLRRDYYNLKINQMLLDKDRFEQNVTVLPIVGMEGTGKATLAKNMFNDMKVQNHFDIRIWISVSDNFDVKQILREILEAETYLPGETLKLDLLARRTRELLSGKLYLIVFDDVWNIDYQKWDFLMDILSVGAKGSKIIVTTRSLPVANIRGTIEHYEFGTLSEDQSWLLFEEMTSGEEPKTTYQTKVGMDIVKECQGHPLLLKTIASMLQLESSEAEWRFFYEDEFLKIWSDGCKYGILSLLKLCYDHLPSPLKHCVAYCGLFPEDHEYDVQILIKLWMAQDFIIDQPGKSLEDVGYEYVLDLIRRCFFQATEIDVREHVTKFQMHDLIYNLAISVAGDKCRALPSYTRGHIEYARTSHVSIDFETSQSSTRFEGFSVEDILQFPRGKIRSIVLPRMSQQKYRRIPGNEFFDMVTSSFRFLRALDMHAFGISIVPPSIDELKLLKYLDLSENEDIMELPNSITKLLNLQTLRLSLCFGLKKLPRDFTNLINLRHLEIDGCYNLTSLPRGIGQMPNLQTLPQRVVSEDTSPNIGLNMMRKEVHIKNLGHENFDIDKHFNREVRSLTLEWESRVKESVEHKKPLNSDKLSDLEELTLLGFTGERLFRSGRSERLFRSGCPSNLVKLSLRKCVNCENLPPLHRLLHLKVLVLDEIAKLKYISDNDPSTTPFFPSLQELCLTELPELRSWWIIGAYELHLTFPCLSKLIIEDCPKLNSMPLFPTLEEGLELDTTCWTPFQLTMDWKAAAQEAPSSSSSPPPLPLSKLKALRIVGIEDRKANEIKWETLTSLQFLRFDFLPNLETLPDGLQQITSLRELHLWRCGIKKIPEWISNLQKLEKLVIRICPRLELLPEAISKLQCLKTLEIEECDTLLRRCERGIGADWKTISSIEKRLLGRIYGK